MATAWVDAALAMIRSASESSPDSDVPPFSIRLADGTTRESWTGKEPRFCLVLKRPDALERLFANPDFKSLGEGFLRDDFDIEGDIEGIYGLAELIERLFGQASPSDTAALGPRSEGPLPSAFDPAPSSSPHERERDAHAIKYHYDLSNTVYGYVTGATRMYSSAYFHSPDDSLDAAQTQKLDRVCRKLFLAPGEALLDIGCGWGGMILHAAREFGVHALGVTISEQQEKLCVERLAREGATERCQVVREDYRAITAAQSPSGKPFDKIVSLGMVEHVGLAQLPGYFRKAFEVLKPGGLFLMQGVSSSVHEPDTRARPFAQSYVFPDADMPYLTQYLRAAEEAGFFVRDVENLREHYALTHRHWRLNLERRRQEIEAEVGMERYRALRLMFSYSTYYFARHRASVYQVLLHKPTGAGPIAQDSASFVEWPMRRPL